MNLLTVAIPAVFLFSASLETRLDWLLVNPLTGLPKYVAASPPTVATAKLGRLLFYDKRLSRDGTVSCASCHQVEHQYSSATAVATGIGGAKGTRKAPPILNKAFASPQFWDGRATTLEEQALGPLFNPIEMGNDPENALKTLRGIAGYGPLFADAFGSNGIDLPRLSRAFSDFERTLLAGDSRWDRWRKDASTPYTEQERMGYALAVDRDCLSCHVPPFFTDNLFHNIGHGYINGAFKDVGRFGFTKLHGGSVKDTGAFKTPTLRNLQNRAPYMHDGSLATLDELVEFYDRGGIENPYLDEKIIPLGLQPSEKKALVAFLMTLQGHGFEVEPPTAEEFPR